MLLKESSRGPLGHPRVKFVRPGGTQGGVGVVSPTDDVDTPTAVVTGTSLGRPSTATVGSSTSTRQRGTGVPTTKTGPVSRRSNFTGWESYQVRG